MIEQSIRVALVDDQRLLREGLRIILETTPDILVIGEAEDGLAAIQLAREQKPDVMLMDIRMPRLDGIAASRTILQILPTCRILLLTTYDTSETVTNGLRAGAAGFLLKDCSAEELCAAVRTVHRGQTVLQSLAAAQLLAGLSLSSLATPQETSSAGEKLGLTKQERAVLRLITNGYNNSEIAKELCVSEVTIKTHINHIFSKLGARDRAQAIVIAHQLHLA